MFCIGCHRANFLGLIDEFRHIFYPPTRCRRWALFRFYEARQKLNAPNDLSTLEMVITEPLRKTEKTLFYFLKIHYFCRFRAKKRFKRWYCYAFLMYQYLLLVTFCSLPWKAMEIWKKKSSMILITKFWWYADSLFDTVLKGAANILLNLNYNQKCEV